MCHGYLSVWVIDEGKYKIRNMNVFVSLCHDNRSFRRRRCDYIVYNISQRTQTVKNRWKSLKLLTLLFCLLFDNAVSTMQTNMIILDVTWQRYVWTILNTWPRPVLSRYLSHVKHLWNWNGNGTRFAFSSYTLVYKHPLCQLHSLIEYWRWRFELVIGGYTRYTIPQLKFRIITLIRPF